MPTLVILAAGMGTRYGKGIKQLTPIGPQGETLMEYSVRDAVAAGFNRIIYIINSSIDAEFNRGPMRRMADVKVQQIVIYQDTPCYRTKPLGTAQAIMLCKEHIQEPFAVINADDYYGAEAMGKAYKYLCDNPKGYGTICYTLRNTLIGSGRVTRGICEIDSAGQLTGIRETKNIIAEGGTVQGYTGDEIVVVNFWLLPPSFVGIAQRNFARHTWAGFDIYNDEWLLPNVIDSMIRNDNIHVDIIKINGRCVGITHESDTEKVRTYLRSEKYPPEGIRGSFCRREEIGGLPPSSRESP